MPARPGIRSGVEGSAEQGGPFPESDETATRPGCRLLAPPASIVADMYAYTVLVSAHLHENSGGMGCVAQGVRQRLLHGTVDKELQRGVGGRFPLSPKDHGKTGGSVGGGQRVELAKRRLRREFDFGAALEALRRRSGDPGGAQDL